MNTIDWQHIYFLSRDSISGLTVPIQFGVILFLILLVIFITAVSVKSGGTKIKESWRQTPPARKFLIFLPACIVITGLTFSIYQTLRDPYALHGTVKEKHLHGTKKIETVTIKVSKAHFFSEKGMGKISAGRTGLQSVRVVSGLYDSIAPGSETVLLVAADDRVYGQILGKEIQISEQP